jgi:hypothetical protein
VNNGFKRMFGGRADRRLLLVAGRTAMSASVERLVPAAKPVRTTELTGIFKSVSDSVFSSHQVSWTDDCELSLAMYISANYREPVGGFWDGGVVPGDVVAATPKAP